ncbi:MAG: GMC family oxidoreductase [Parvibaculaceae bacterium]
MSDYIIIGGGSAGCVMAARLSEMADAKVLLIEAGPRDTNPYIHMPCGFFKMTGGPLTWGYTTAPAAHANAREMVYPQARVLGGGSSINAQVYTRGAPEDYDRWAEEDGCAGWSSRALLPYFVKAEDNDRLGAPFHGQGGPLGVSTLAKPNIVTEAFVAGCREFGMPANPDFNSGRQEGTAVYQMTIRRARRCSAATGYLKPALSRPNLTVRTDAFITRIVIEKGRAIGVALQGPNGAEIIRAEREVILTAGAIGSPKLLMLSGIGPATHLKEKGIDVAQDLPGVGQNLQDHMASDMVWQLNGPYSYDKYKKLHWQAIAGIEYLLFRSGPVASSLVEGGAFWWSDRSEKTPDLQFHFLPGAGVEEGVGEVPGGNGATLNSYHLRPRSRGSVTLRSSDPRDAPVVDPNSFAEPYDLERAVDGIMISREIGRTKAFSKYVAREHLPGDDCKTKADFARFARAVARSAYHPVGTCKMGVDEMAVVDPSSLRVRGIDGLRLCDSSIMPRLVSSNTNAPTIAMAEKGADIIKGNRVAA